MTSRLLNSASRAILRRDGPALKNATSSIIKRSESTIPYNAKVTTKYVNAIHPM